MDTVQAVMSDKGVNIESFVLSGESKRGGVAWLTAAVDARTDSLIPVVIDNLKGEAFIDHVHRCWQRVWQNQPNSRYLI
jgi:PhoPQ-activated pathogenicity-related protein